MNASRSAWSISNLTLFKEKIRWEKSFACDYNHECRWMMPLKSRSDCFSISIMKVDNRNKVIIKMLPKKKNRKSNVSSCDEKVSKIRNKNEHFKDVCYRSLKETTNESQEKPNKMKNIIRKFPKCNLVKVIAKQVIVISCYNNEVKSRYVPVEEVVWSASETFAFKPHNSSLKKENETNRVVQNEKSFAFRPEIHCFKHTLARSLVSSLSLQNKHICVLWQKEPIHSMHLMLKQWFANEQFTVFWTFSRKIQFSINFQYVVVSFAFNDMTMLKPEDYSWFVLQHKREEKTCNHTIVSIQSAHAINSSILWSKFPNEISLIQLLIYSFDCLQKTGFHTHNVCLSILFGNMEFSRRQKEKNLTIYRCSCGKNQHTIFCSHTHQNWHEN